MQASAQDEWFEQFAGTSKNAIAAGHDHIPLIDVTLRNFAHACVPESVPQLAPRVSTLSRKAGVSFKEWESSNTRRVHRG